MKVFRVALLSLLVSARCNADDATIARQLEGLGGKVKVVNEAVTEVSFTNCEKLGDAEFRTIGQLAHLKSLTLFGGKQKLTDQTVEHLLGLKELETLATEGARLSDKGLARLATLAKLRAASFFHLSFRLEGFTGVGFAAWRTLPALQKLTVAGMSMGDEGFAAIAQISTLRDLSTWHTYQTEAGNAHIATLPLTSLKVGQRLPQKGAPPSFSDASLPTLATIQTLETLKLTEARLTLAALRELKKLPKLKQLHISECDIASVEVDALRGELPNVNIDFQPLTDEQRKKLEMYLK
jgi:hypothetical protein